MIEADDALDAAIKQRRDAAKFSTGSPTLDVYAAGWLAGLRLAPSTVQGYEKIVRNHLVPELGTLRIDKITSTRIARHYRELEKNGRRDFTGFGKPLSANTVNKVHIVLGSILDAAVDDNLIATNPAKKKRTVNAPGGKQIRAERPEISTWSSSQLHAFLHWNRDTRRRRVVPTLANHRIHGDAAQ